MVLFVRILGSYVFKKAFLIDSVSEGLEHTFFAKGGVPDSIGKNVTNTDALYLNKSSDFHENPFAENLLKPTIPK